MVFFFLENLGIYNFCFILKLKVKYFYIVFFMVDKNKGVNVLHSGSSLLSGDGAFVNNNTIFFSFWENNTKLFLFLYRCATYKLKFYCVLSFSHL